MCVARTTSRRNRSRIAAARRSSRPARHNLLGLVGLNAAMTLLLELAWKTSPANSFARAMLRARLAGERLFGAERRCTPENASGIVTFFKAGSGFARAAPRAARREHRDVGYAWIAKASVTSVSRRTSIIRTLSCSGSGTPLKAPAPFQQLATSGAAGARPGARRRCPLRCWNARLDALAAKPNLL